MQGVQNRSFYAGGDSVPRQYPWMSVNESCEVVVIGGGLTGCFAVWQLASAGIDAVLLSRKPIGFSSVLVDHSVFGWQNDFPLTSLIASVGKETAVRMWKLCQLALDELEIFSKTAEEVGFRRRDALMYVSDPKDCEALHAEYLLRKHNGFEVGYLVGRENKKEILPDQQAVLLAPGAAAECDGYRLCHALALAAEKLGARIYENTTVVSMLDIHDGRQVRVQTETGHDLIARKVVLAIGQRQEGYLPTFVARRTAYGIMTEPIHSVAAAENLPLIRNASREITLYGTKGGRILVGGLGCTLPEEDGHLFRLVRGERLIERQYAELVSCAGEMLCGMGEPAAVCAFHNTCGQTKDGLPIVGRYPTYPNLWFDFIPGENGGLCALTTGKMLADLYRGKGKKREIFSPLRRTLG